MDGYDALSCSMSWLRLGGMLYGCWWKQCRSDGLQLSVHSSKGRKDCFIIKMRLLVLWQQRNILPVSCHHPVCMIGSHVTYSFCLVSSRPEDIFLLDPSSLG